MGPCGRQLQCISSASFANVLCLICSLFFLICSTLLDCACSLESLFVFLNETNESQFCAVTKSSCSCSVFRHQPGSAALPGDQSHGVRFRSSFCSQHQPRLLSPALWLCQRTGIVPSCVSTKSKISPKILQESKSHSQTNQDFVPKRH